MKVTVVGTGYVGLVTGVCLAEFGHRVTCVDKDADKIHRLRAGESPIHEAGLDDLLNRQIKLGRLDFTTSLLEALPGREVLIIAVGTPTSEDGSADLRYVHAVADEIGDHLSEPLLVITKSTVPVGTTDQLRERINARLMRRGVTFRVDLASNPEFLREGNAVQDTLQPDRIVVGLRAFESEKILRELYAPLIDQGVRFVCTVPTSSEMAKYAANSMLATRISMMNEFSMICEEVGADIEIVREAIGADHRIGSHFLRAGVGFGGSCFPKDLAALIHTGEIAGLKPEILKAVVSVNQRQRERFVKRVLAASPKKIGVWGLAFKPGTDDVRDAPAFEIISALLENGIEVVAHDPMAIGNFRKEFGDRPRLVYAEKAMTALEGADALVLLTEWPEYLTIAPTAMKTALRQPLVFDGRNTRKPAEMKNAGLRYASIGRADE